MINYAQGIFTRTYIQDNKKFYASFHPEVIVERETYELTGRWLVVLLHPTIGLQSFFLNRDNETKTWLPDDNSRAIIEDELIEWCNHQINTQIDKNDEIAIKEKKFP
jgi:hypothetical protein